MGGIFKTCCPHGAALAGSRTALVGTSWIISHLVSTNDHINHSSPLVGTPFLGLQAVFSEEDCFLVGEAHDLKFANEGCV